MRALSINSPYAQGCSFSLLMTSLIKWQPDEVDQQQQVRPVQNFSSLGKIPHFQVVQVVYCVKICLCSQTSHLWVKFLIWGFSWGSSFFFKKIKPEPSIRYIEIKIKHQMKWNSKDTTKTCPKDKKKFKYFRQKRNSIRNKEKNPYRINKKIL